MVNYLSIDFESWVYPDLPEFQKLTNEQRKRIDNGYVEDSAEKLLKILDKYSAKLTFFVLGQLYKWYPKTIEKIAAKGHEIAYHTDAHEFLSSKKVLVHSLEKSKKFLNKFKPKGFRAPQVSIKKEYFTILRNYGFEYDSSTYGPYFSKRRISGILEIPISKLSFLPIGSGYFMAILGKRIIPLYRLINRRRKPVIAFVHNWQIFKPKKATFPNGGYLLKRPYYLPYTFEVTDTFEHLLRNFSFAPMKLLCK